MEPKKNQMLENLKNKPFKELTDTEKALAIAITRKLKQQKIENEKEQESSQEIIAEKKTIKNKLIHFFNKYEIAIYRIFFLIMFYIVFKLL